MSEEMRVLSENDYAAISQRFVTFYDAVAVAIEIQLRPTTECRILLEAKDTESKTGWSRVLFVVEQADSFRFAQDERDYFAVLSDGLQIIWKDDFVFVVIDAFQDEDVLAALDTNIAYVRGKRVRYEVLPNSSKVVGST